MFICTKEIYMNYYEAGFYDLSWLIGIFPGLLATCHLYMWGLSLYGDYSYQNLNFLINIKFSASNFILEEPWVPISKPYPMQYIFLPLASRIVSTLLIFADTPRIILIIKFSFSLISLYGYYLSISALKICPLRSEGSLFSLTLLFCSHEALNIILILIFLKVMVIGNVLKRYQ